MGQPCVGWPPAGATRQAHGALQGRGRSLQRGVCSHSLVARRGGCCAQTMKCKLSVQAHLYRTSCTHAQNTLTAQEDSVLAQRVTASRTGAAAATWPQCHTLAPTDPAAVMNHLFPRSVHRWQRGAEVVRVAHWERRGAARWWQCAQCAADCCCAAGVLSVPAARRLQVVRRVGPCSPTTHLLRYVGTTPPAAGWQGCAAHQHPLAAPERRPRLPMAAPSKHVLLLQSHRPVCAHTAFSPPPPLAPPNKMALLRSCCCCNLCFGLA